MKYLSPFFISLIFSSIAAAAPSFTADMVRGGDLRISRYDEVVARVIQGSLDEQERFAEVALGLMIDAFESELDADRDLMRETDRVKARGWSAGTRRYVEQLHRISALVGFSRDLQVLRERDGAVRIVIGDEQVMLSVPRPNEQGRFERLIAERVCRHDDCSAQALTVEERVVQREASLKSEWRFASDAQPVYSSGDGLRCTFDDQRHLVLKKRACEQLLFELRLFSETIKSLHAHGKFVNWSSMKIEHVGPGSAQKLSYNDQGGFVRLHLPNLLRASHVWRSAIPWVRANAGGKILQHIVQIPDQIVYLTSKNLADHE